MVVQLDGFFNHEGHKEHEERIKNIFSVTGEGKTTLLYSSRKVRLIKKYFPLCSLCPSWLIKIKLRL